MSCVVEPKNSELGKAKELLDQYKESDIFEQSKLAVDFVELYADKLLSIALLCKCEHPGSQNNTSKSLELLEEEFKHSIERLKRRLENGA